MESRLAVYTFLCGLVLLGWMELIDCAPAHSIPKNVEEDINILRRAIDRSHVPTEQKEKEIHIFKGNLSAMETLFKPEAQRVLVQEMLLSYSRLFRQFSQQSASLKQPVDHLLQFISRTIDHLDVNSCKKFKDMQHSIRNEMVNGRNVDYLAVCSSKKFKDMQHSFRNEMWDTPSPMRILKALDEFLLVSNKSRELIKHKKEEENIAAEH